MKSQKLRLNGDSGRRGEPGIRGLRRQGLGIALSLLALMGLLSLLSLLSLTAGCHSSTSRPPATTQTRPPAPSAPSTTSRDTASDEASRRDLMPVDESDDILSMSLEDINANSPLSDIRFDYDSAELTGEARTTLDTNVQWLRRNPSVTILIEGHCDERGTVEYNLALGERRSMAAYNFLVASGLPSERIKTISYGKEFPLDPGHHEAAWARNRRAHFVITSK